MTEEGRRPGLEARTPSGLERPGPSVESVRGEEWFEELQRKDGTKKGELTGVDRGARKIEGSERGEIGRGMRRKKQARGAGMQGPKRT